MKMITLSSLGNIVTGKTPPTNDAKFFDGAYNFVTPSDLNWKTYFCRSTERTITEEARKALNNQFIPKNSIMVTCIGNTIGKCAISSDCCLTNQQINTVIPHDHIDHKFVYYLILNNIAVLRGIGLGGGAATPILNKSTFSNVKVNVPTSSCWGKIASILSAYDDLIENNRRRIQLLEESARQLYKEWFVRLRFPGHEHVKVVEGVPEGWIAKGKVAELGEIVTGKTPSKSKENYYGDDILFIKTPDMHGNILVVDSAEKLSFEGASSQRNKSLPPRSIMVSCIGSVGVVAFNAVVAQTNQQINSIVIQDDTLRYWAFFTAKLFTPILEGMGGGATMANVNKSKFSSIKIDIPAREILQQFSETTKPLIDQIEQLTKTNYKLAQARDLLLPKLMSGEVAV